MQEPGFWDDPEKSNQKMREAKNLKDIVETVRGLESQYEDIMTLIEMGYEDNDPAIIPDISEELETFKKTFEEIRVSTLLSGEYDRNNAILRLNAGAGGTRSCGWRPFCPGSMTSTMPSSGSTPGLAGRSPATGAACCTGCIQDGRSGKDFLWK